MSVTPAAVDGRVTALDGLRGLVIVSVVLNHASGLLWPRGAAYDIPVLRGLLGGGAVVVFFVVGAFIVTLGLLRDSERERNDPLRFYLRRLIRLCPQLVVLCVAVWVAAQFDPEPPSDQRMLTNSLHVLTFTLNDLTVDDPLAVRPELGHLWYLSVQQQCYLVLPLLLVLFARRRAVLAVLLMVAIGLVYWHRQEVLEAFGWMQASSRTTTRADGLIWGVVLALMLPWLVRLQRFWATLLVASSVALLGLKVLLPELPELAYLGPWSLAFTFVAGVAVVAIHQLPAPTRFSRALSWRPLARLGKSSLSIYLWHLPIIFVVKAHTPGWSWPERTGLAVAALVMTVVMAERFIDEPVRRWLASEPRLRVRAA